MAAAISLTISFLFLGTPIAPVQGYTIIIENNVDSDSDIDSNPNLGNDGATSYVDAQTLDGTDQVINEEDTGGGGGSGGQLPSAKDTLASDTTTSATYEDVDGLTVQITTSATSDILLFASVQALSTSSASVGGWRLVFDSVNFLDLERQLDDTEPANINLVDLVDDKTAGTYTFKLQHQIDTGTLTSANSIIVAVSLHNTEGIVPANDSYVASDTVGNSWADITGLTADITLSRTSHIWAMMVMNGYHSGANKDTDFAINIDATRMETHDRDWQAASEYGCVSINTRTDTAKAAGTYTVKAEWRGSGGSTMTGEDFSLVVIAAEANSGADIIDIQKDVVTTESTTATSIENIDGLNVTATVNTTAHVLAILTLSTDTTQITASAYTTIDLNGTDQDVMERGHTSATRWGSVGQVVRTDSTVGQGDFNATGRWYTDTGNTLTGGNLILTTIVLLAGEPGVGGNYELQWEHQISSPAVDGDKDTYYLCIFGQATGGDSETFEIQMWDWGGSDWDAALGTVISTTEQWHNQTISSTYIDASDRITYRFRGTSESGDTTQSTLNIDWSGIRAYNVSVYNLESLAFGDHDPNGELAWPSSPLQIQVESGNTYDIQIKGTDTTGTPIADGTVYWNTVDNFGTATALTTSYIDVYTSQSSGNNSHNIYFWVQVLFTPGDPPIPNDPQAWDYSILIVEV